MNPEPTPPTKPVFLGVPDDHVLSGPPLEYVVRDKDGGLLVVTKEEFLARQSAVAS